MTTTPTKPLWRQMLEAREKAGPLPALQIAEELRVVFEHLAQDDCTPLLSLMDAAELAAEEGELMLASTAVDVQPQPSARLPLTADQQDAVEKILAEIRKKDACPVLCGYAGTGKTVTTAALVTRLVDQDLRVVVATPTHKARAQVERALRERGADGFEVVTVHRLLGLKQVRDRNTGKETFEPDRNGKNMLTEEERYSEEHGHKVPIHQIDVVIVDETSMLNSELYDLLRGELNGRPVVFVGDDRQLLPVGEEEVCKAFTKASEVYRLTQVLRHDGAILNLATATREMAMGRARFASAEGGGSRVVAYKSREQWLEQLLELAASHQAMDDPDYCRALAWTNKAVEELNERIHARRYGANAPQFLAGMTCVTVDAIPGPDGTGPLINSTMDVLIQEACDIQHRFVVDDRATNFGFEVPTTWRLWDLTVAFPGDCVEPIRFKVIHRDSEKQWNNTQREIAKAAKDSTGVERSMLWDLYFKRKDCVGKLQPASALTIHKSQGSTFQNVWLHWSIDGWGSAPTAQQNQLAYVGITRAAESLHVVGDR